MSAAATVTPPRNDGANAKNCRYTSPSAVMTRTCGPPPLPAPATISSSPSPSRSTAATVTPPRNEEGNTISSRRRVPSARKILTAASRPAPEPAITSSRPSPSVSPAAILTPRRSCSSNAKNCVCTLPSMPKTRTCGPPPAMGAVIISCTPSPSRSPTATFTPPANPG